MYRNILFDLYGTLIDIHTDETEARFWNTLALFFSYNGANYTAESLRLRYQALVDERLVQHTDTRYPDTRVVEVFGALYAERGVRASGVLLAHTARLFRAASTAYIRLYPGTEALLGTLRGHGRRLFILSNGQREFSEPELCALGVFDAFDALYSSATYGVCKPDPAFYNVLLEKEKLNAAECLFIGNDHLTDIAGAKAVGMDSIYIHSNQSRDVKKTDATYEIWDGDVSKILPFALR